MLFRSPAPHPIHWPPRSDPSARLSRVSPLPHTPFTARPDRLSRPNPIRSRGPPRTPFTASPIASPGPPRTPFTARPIASPGPPRARFTGRPDPFLRPARSTLPARLAHKLALLNLLNRGRQPASWNWCPTHPVGFCHTSYFIEPTYPPLPIILLPTEPLL